MARTVTARPAIRIVALVGLSSAGVVATVCIAPHVPPSAATAPDVRQLALIAGAMADYAKTDKITVVRVSCELAVERERKVRIEASAVACSSDRGRQLG